MTATQTLEVPHMGTKVGYAISNGKLDPSKPTCVMINSMNTTVSLYKAQLSSPRLTELMNVLAIEPLGHGATATKEGHWTYWDTARCALQAMTALGVDKAFALGTSQGGWIVVRMALLAPERILGVIPLGTSMDSESAESQTKGCWDAKGIAKPFLAKWSSPSPTPDFVIDDEWVGLLIQSGFGASAPKDVVDFWTKTLQTVYSGDEGRRKMKATVTCLAERDGLLLRLGDVTCPVHWLHGTNDTIYGTQVPKEHIELFTNSKDARLQFVEGGTHFLSASNPDEVENAVVEMVKKYK
ncbi:putative alpha/beta hydrolase [Xylariomycetidae sp. FL0641]|nr:putative alpha/beta hydrolase [Xylariomycetidae sp. FL0641]